MLAGGSRAQGSRCRVLSKGEAGHFTVVVAIMEAQPEEEDTRSVGSRASSAKVPYQEMHLELWDGGLRDTVTLTGE